MIQRLWIQSFKAFGGPRPDAAGIPLQPFTVLVGPNGSGKSTILQAIDLLGWISRGPLQAMLDAHQWDYADLRHQRSRARSTVHAEIELAGASAAWTVELGAQESAGIVEEVIAKGIRPDDRVLVERRDRDVQRYSEKTGLRDFMAFTASSSS